MMASGQVELRNGSLWKDSHWIPVDEEAIDTGLDLYVLETSSSSRPADGPLPPRAVEVILALDRRMQSGRLASLCAERTAA